MLELAKGRPGTYAVHFRVVVDDATHEHAVMFQIFEFAPDQQFFAMALDNNKNSCPMSYTELSHLPFFPVKSRVYLITSTRVQQPMVLSSYCELIFIPHINFHATLTSSRYPLTSKKRVNFEQKDKTTKHSAKLAFRQIFKQNKVFNTAKRASIRLVSVYQVRCIE